MKVHGMENLRVVDASAMPRTTNGNIHAPVLMLAEKAADIIRGRQPLEPQYVDYYKHGVHDESWRNGRRSILSILIELSSSIKMNKSYSIISEAFK